MNLKSFEDMQKTTVFFMLKPATAIYGFILAVIISFLVLTVWACIAPVDEVVKGQVLLRPSQNVSSVKCVISGQLNEKNFENDQIVRKGDILFRLESSVYESELESYRKELSKNESNFIAVEVLLDAVRNGRKFDARKYSSDDCIKANAYLMELKKYEEQIVDLQNKLSREESKPEMLKVPYTIQDLKRQIEQSRLSFDVWKTNAKDNALETSLQLSSAKKSLESKIKEMENLIKGMNIQSPIDGRIAEITKHNTGDYVFAGEELVRIVPQDCESLIADIYVDPNYIAQVNVGDAVKIKFPGLPPSRYGQIETVVQIIPPDASYVKDVPVFVVEAKIDEPYLIAKNSRRANLIPGITAEARIITERCTVMQMVLKKLDFLNS